MRPFGVRPAWLLAAALAFIAVARFIPSARALESVVEAKPARTAITSIQGQEATLPIGANAGLEVGMELVVLQDGEEAGRLVLTQVDAASAVGRVTSREGFTVRVLDAVALPAAGAPPAVEPSPAPPIRPAMVKEAPAPKRRDGKMLPAYHEHETDVIPWERWEYLALSALAADGLLPGWASREFQGERQFTRGELARFTATAMVNFAAGAGTDRDRVFLERLAHEFRLQPPVRRAQSAIAELDLPRPPERLETPITPLGPMPAVPALSLYGGPRLSDFQDDTDLTFTGRVGGILDLSPNAFVAASVNNLHYRFNTKPDEFRPVDVLTLNLRAWDADWEFGKSYWFSGPLHQGDALLSDNSPGLYMAKVRKAFAWGGFPGKFMYTQVYGGFSDHGDTKYYGLRRVEKRLSDTIEFGMSEAYVATNAPNPTIIFLPFYAYQHLKIFHGGKRNTGNDTFNYMAQVDLSAKLRSSFTLYGEIFLDDIKAPSGLGAGFDVPRKVGMVLGGHFPKLFGWRGDARFEIYHADRETYLGIAPQVGWNQNDLLLGSPFGPNTQAFYGRLDYRATPALKATLQLHDAVQYKLGLPDMGDRYSLDARLAWDVRPNQSMSLRLIDQRFRGQAYTTRATALELFGSWAY